MAIGPIQLLRQATTGQRRTLLAAALGWMLDAFDAMLYALVLAHVMRALACQIAGGGPAPHARHGFSVTCPNWSPG
jgi:hypothetical protein